MHHTIKKTKKGQIDASEQVVMFPGTNDQFRHSPGIPSDPGKPDVPGLPTSPFLPSMPGNPSEPGEPSLPGVPGRPDSPFVPGKNIEKMSH